MFRVDLNNVPQKQKGDVDHYFWSVFSPHHYQLQAENSSGPFW